jgi:hypothetical protein
MSLWQLLRGSYSGYGVDDYETAFDSDSPRPLDPVFVAGQANIRGLLASSRRYNVGFVVLLISLILNSEDFPVLRTVTQERSIRFTNKKYREHFRCLVEWKLLCACLPEQIRFFNTYFAVPKGEEYARAIFNGKRLSSLMPTPPPVNIFDIPRFLEKLSDIPITTGVWLVIGDIRHWFHQIPVSFELSRFFGVALSVNETFRWTCLPMGWSFSPAIAQALGWAMLCHRESGEFAHVKIDDLEVSPTFVTLFSKIGQRVGFLALYYDNYIVVSTDADVARIMHNRIERNARLFNIALKEHKLFTRKELFADPPIFLGIEIGLTRKRHRDEGLGIHWRIHKRNLRYLCAMTYPAREIAQVIGRILYFRLVSLSPLGTHESTRGVLQLLRRVSKEAWLHSWATARIAVSVSEASAIAQEVDCANGDEWNGATAAPSKIAYVATDACDKGWGFVILNEAKIIYHSGQLEYPATIAGDHIFIKELFAALQGVFHARTKEVALVVVALDNTAAAGVLRRRYSTNQKANVLLAELDTRIRVVTVAGSDNVADAPSRGAIPDQEKAMATWKAIVGYDQGVRHGKQLKKFDNCQDPVRHAEPEDENEDQMIENVIAEACT